MCFCSFFLLIFLTNDAAFNLASHEAVDVDPVIKDQAVFDRLRELVLHEGLDETVSVKLTHPNLS